MSWVETHRQLRRAIHDVVDTMDPSDFHHDEDGALWQERVWRSPERAAQVTAVHEFLSFVGRTAFHNFNLNLTFDEGATTMFELSYYTGHIMSVDRMFQDDESVRIWEFPFYKPRIHRASAEDYQRTIAELDYGAKHL